MRKRNWMIYGAWLAAASLTASAAGQHEGHHSGHDGPHDSAMKDMELDMESMSMDDLNMGAMKKLPITADDAPMGHGSHGGHGNHGDHGTHAHDFWYDPPEDYAKFSYDQWDNYNRAKEGMAIYRDNCMMCHGVDGKGSGPLSQKLKHAPADLSNHFHRKPGDGDAYLFWRVSEGGGVEPFAGMDSAMPAFKETLSHQQRWDVLVYIHQAFHDGYSQRKQIKSKGGHGSHH